MLTRTFGPLKIEKGLTSLQVIRCAEHGVLILSKITPTTWVPAYWTSDATNTTSEALATAHVTPSTTSCHSAVVDTTGAGNAFLGGFTMGLLKTRDPVRAACYGAVSASFVVQQIGLPKLTVEETDADGKLEEKWNGDLASGRLERQLQNTAHVLESISDVVERRRAWIAEKQRDRVDGP